MAGVPYMCFEGCGRALQQQHDHRDRQRVGVGEQRGKHWLLKAAQPLQWAQPQVQRWGTGNKGRSFVARHAHARSQSYVE